MRAFTSHLLPESEATLTHTHRKQARGPLARASHSPRLTDSVGPGAAAAVSHRDKRSRQCEQTDREQHQRAVPMSDPAHDPLLSGFSNAPVTVECTANRAITGR